MDIKHTLFKLRVHWGEFKRIINLFAEGLILLASLASVFLLVFQFGYTHSEQVHEYILQYRVYILLAFFIGITIRYFTRFKDVIQEKMLYIDLILYLMLISTLCANVFFRQSFSESFPYLDFLMSPTLLSALLFTLCIIHLSRLIFILIETHIKPSLLFLLSFLFFILMGWGLLLLPNATLDGIGFLDALFTSTSAVCITGLTTVDVATTFTRTGHIIIITLMQIGSIGVMTFTSFIALSFMKNSSFSSKLMLKDLLSENRTDGLFRVIFNILTVTLLIEAVGAWLIYLEIRGSFGNTSEDIFFAVFHSIAAFCSAGFSTISGGYTHPMLAEKHSLHICISLLIILGGIGFPILFNYLKAIRYTIMNHIKVWLGLQKHLIHLPRIINLHTHVVMISTALLIVSGFICFFIFEYNNSLSGMSLGGKMAESLLGSVTPRTGGITAIPTTTLSNPTLIITLFLMMIGAAPMSTGGGLKVTTVFVAIVTMISLMKEKETIEIKKRQIAAETVKRSLTIITFYFLWLGFVFCFLAYTEKEVPLFTLLFEAVSALSTVGLSLDFTPLLSDAGKVILCVTMLIGRIGLLTFFATFWNETKKKHYAYPTETILM